MSINCPSLSFLITLGWTSILFDIRMSISVCFFGPFGTQIFRIESSSWQILPLMSIKCPSLSFLITLGWKSILSDIRMATPACSLGPFVWKIVFQPIPLSYFLYFSLRRVSCKQQNVGSCLCSQSVSLSFYWGIESVDIKRY